MPSALETLVKILKLERDTEYKNTAVIGGLESFAKNWANDAHQQAKRPEHHQLVDELVSLMAQYGGSDDLEMRHETVKYMLGRIMGRIPAPPDLPPSPYASDEPPAAPPTPEQEAPTTSTPPPSEASIDETVEEDDLRVDGEEDITDAGDDTDTEDADDYFDDDDDPGDYAPSAPQAPPVRAIRRKRPASLTPEQIAERLEALNAPVTSLHRVGEKMASKLATLGVHTIRDLLFYFPWRYDDYTQLKPLNRLKAGEEVTIVAGIHSLARKQASSKRPYLQITVEDGTARMHINFFGQMWLQRQFRPGSQVVFSGKVELFRGELTMTNPQWEMVERENLHTGRIVPVYGLTKGISARTMRRMLRQVLDQWADQVPDHLPDSVLDRTGLADINWALQQIHFPDDHESLALAQQRLTFDELFLFQMSVLANRRDWQAVPGQPLPVDDVWLQEALDTLPYALTDAQQRVLNDIRADIARDVPMNRLLQGDVGSGKTIVAALALAMTVHHGKQAALMAPTSILAEQHARSIGEFLRQMPGGEAINVRLLTGNTSTSEREAIYAGLADGSIDVVIGTHALIQEGVTFHDLALAVIDEQHRFGVEQRGSLRSKGTHPHILVMTATPIPRTLALTLYADLDLSIIDEMPPGRMPIDTRIILPTERERVYSFIDAQLQRGRQVFIVYPLVEASESLQNTGAAVDQYAHLSETVFPQHSTGLLHGRMSPAEKEAVMAAFAAGEIQILISTSVIEVGIDVPNATVIVIEDADRFGLAQLHQFRGRVGRGEHQSYCLLISSSHSEDARQRLAAMEETTDGFKLAEIDWQMRGPGDLLGVRQSGTSKFRLVEQMNPRQVELAQREARTVYAEDPYLTQPEHHLLAQRIIKQIDERVDVS